MNSIKLHPIDVGIGLFIHESINYSGKILDAIGPLVSFTYPLAFTASKVGVFYSQITKIEKVM